MQESEKTVKLGDAVAAVTYAVGVKPCKGCKRRQAYLNERNSRIAQLAAKGLIKLAEVIESV